MEKWRDAFDAGVADEERAARYKYVFGPPATADELAHLERQLGISLPTDVREMFAEFNGVWQQSPGCFTRSPLSDDQRYSCGCPRIDAGQW